MLCAERPKAAVDVRPVTRREIADLTVPQMVTLAARSALRAVPLFRACRDRPSDAQRADLLAVDASVTLAMCSAAGLLRGDIAHVLRAAASRADAAAARAAPRNAGADRDTYTEPDHRTHAAHAAAFAADAAVDAPDAVCTAVDAAADACADACDRFARTHVRAAARWDYYFLLIPPPAGDVGTPSALLELPLWPEDAGGPPEGWHAGAARWVSDLETLGIADVAAWYREAIDEHRIDWTAAVRRLERWSGAEIALPVQKPQAVAADNAAPAPVNRSAEPVTPVRIAGLAPSTGDPPVTTDLLDRTPLVRAVAETVSDTDHAPPQAIALFGAWGAGKTTVMRLLHRQLSNRRPRRFDFAWFNARQYEQNRRVATDLADELAAGLLEIAGACERRRLIAFVDDLDCCEPECVAAVFDAVRRLNDVERVIVVIGIDPHIATEVIGRQYSTMITERHTRGAVARDCLGKIIQLPIGLRRPDERSVERFVRDRLFPGTPAPDAARTPMSPRNPAGGRVTSPGTAMPPDTPTADVESGPPPSTAAEDAGRFRELANAFGFHNPRRLIRLRNTHRLLKRLRDLRGSPAAATDDRIRWMVFWQEFLHEHPPAVRDTCREALVHKSPLDALPEPVHDTVAAVRERIRTAFNIGRIRPRAFDATARFVIPFTLPAATDAPPSPAR